MFHFRQNILLKVYNKILPNLSDSNNPGSLNAFRALTDKAKDLSNQENKIKDSIELHYQFLMMVSEAYVEEKLFSIAVSKYGTNDLKKVSAAIKDCGESEMTHFLDDVI